MAQKMSSLFSTCLSFLKNCEISMTHSIYLSAYLEKKLNASAHFVCNYFYQLLLVRNCITLVLKTLVKLLSFGVGIVLHTVLSETMFPLF